ncbi:uncharacterized protein LOC131841338 [Achroia grisella]|uniref:uncharacterized protein LOC131841338 n=1 Tax=Achroia grisella TaxID=688607 RepID=UPI0027D323CF|nr:uncharacterized protein LOC131841338 [Achroia grisella]
MRDKSTNDGVYVKCIKDDKGKVLMKEDDIKDRWKNYFENLMNEENSWNKSIGEERVNVGLVREVRMEEVKQAVRSMKSSKAVGPDGIPVEVWKLLGENGYKWLTLFFNKLLHEETIPEEWCQSILVPIFKNKGDVILHYRGIKLMSHTMKVWEKMIERRLREECDISQNQFGFMPGRGTTDAIFALRQLCEKYRNVNKNLHMVFVDLEKAYDRIPRLVLWWALKKKGVPGNPYLFLIVMDALTSDIQDEVPWCMLFADDIVLVGEDGIEVQSRLDRWQEKLESVGLKISRTKTEYLFCDFGGLSSFKPIYLNGVMLPVCSDFRYLGSVIQNTVRHRMGGMDEMATGLGNDMRPPNALETKG